MTECLEAAGAQARLPRIKFPRVQVGDEWAALAVNRAKTQSRKPIRIESEIAAAADGQWITEAAPYGPWKFPDRPAGADDPMRSQRRPGDAVAVVVRRVDAGINAEAFLDEHIQRPQI